ncbi:hypothetical protein LTR36_010061 [Oleoguttula mirabilis]|uniref:Uncharacterized protein n=1 Tax=Oleoguttula mirabilis TaxID=1507867 RepID=A0AAV9JT01_9PEZI|nr:hypothetical protein LTR36_010061 [Oleoguttula mirabilis]
MRHKHGIEVTLQDTAGSQVTEYANTYATGLHKYNGKVGSRLISVKPGKTFQVCITIGEDFKIYKAKGVKIVIVAIRSDAASGKLVRRSQAWWVGVDGSEPEAEYVLEYFTNGEDITAKNQRVAFAMPQPADDYATATADWVVQEQYSANNGCIAVFVERGTVDEEKMREEFSPLDTRQVLRHKLGSPLPICLHWFYPLRSENSDPYVFEFRNMRKDDLDLRQLDTSSEVGYHTDDLLASDDEITSILTSSDSSDSTPEEATDAEESDADSTSESDAPVTPRKRRMHSLQSMKGHKQRRINTSPSKASAKPLKWGPLSSEKAVDWKTQACRDEDDEEPLPVWPKREFKTEDTAKKGKGRKAKLVPSVEDDAAEDEMYPPLRPEEAYSIGAKKAGVHTQQGNPAATTLANDRNQEDEQALNDELRAIEIRQKLRRIKKLGKRN